MNGVSWPVQASSVQRQLEQRHWINSQHLKEEGYYVPSEVCVTGGNWWGSNWDPSARWDDWCSRSSDARVVSSSPISCSQLPESNKPSSLSLISRSGCVPSASVSLQPFPLFFCSGRKQRSKYNKTKDKREKTEQRAHKRPRMIKQNPAHQLRGDRAPSQCDAGGLI